MTTSPADAPTTSIDAHAFAPTTVAGPFVLVGLGASVPPARERIADAIAHLETHPMATVLSQSDIIDSAAFGGATAQRFANAAVLLASPLPPHMLLRSLWAIEARAGRLRGRKNGPRTLDLDILACSAGARDLPGLTLPHPGLKARPFAQLPAREALARGPQCARLALSGWVG